MRQCVLYYPNPPSLLKRCRNCERVIDSDRPIEQYRTVMCGHYQGGPVATMTATAVHEPKPVRGVGTICSDILRERHGAIPCQACMKTIATMDENGPEWCAENVESLARQMQENAKSGKRWLHKMLATFTPELFLSTAQSVILEAVEIARKNTTVRP
jgi:hypothetical protein